MCSQCKLYLCNSPDTYTSKYRKLPKKVFFQEKVLNMGEGQSPTFPKCCLFWPQKPILFAKNHFSSTGNSQPQEGIFSKVGNMLSLSKKTNENPKYREWTQKLGKLSHLNDKVLTIWHKLFKNYFGADLFLRLHTAKRVGLSMQIFHSHR